MVKVMISRNSATKDGENAKKSRCSSTQSWFLKTNSSPNTQTYDCNTELNRAKKLFVYCYYVDYILSSYHEKAIKALLRARLEGASYLVYYIKKGESR